jgi:hypothetical protein
VVWGLALVGMVYRLRQGERSSKVVVMVVYVAMALTIVPTVDWGGELFAPAMLLTYAGMAVYAASVALLFPKEELHAKWHLGTLVGYALSGTARGWLADAIAIVNARTATQCLSLDVPSGFDSQLGRPTGVTIRPDAILTIAAPKAGLIESFSSCPVFLADISVPASVFAKSTGKSFAPPADISRIVSGNSGA